MKLAQLSAFAAALVMSSLVMAEGGDRAFEKMMVANDRSVELFVAKEQARGPVVLNEKKDEKTKDL